MSYILKALARSERSRSMRAGPDLNAVFDAPPVERGRRSGWGVMLAVSLISVLVAAVSWYLFARPAPDAMVAVPRVPVAVQPPVAAVAPPATVPATVGVPVASLLLQAGSMPAAARSGPSEDEESARRDRIPAPLLPAATQAAPQPAAARGTVRRVYELAGVQLLVHIYSTVPAARFALINNEKYREGEQLAHVDGRVVEITDEGVILDMPEGRVHLLMSAQ